jgi:type VI protein secretion system component VasK
LTQNQAPLLGVIAFVSANTGWVHSANPPGLNPSAQDALSGDAFQRIEKQFQPAHYVLTPQSSEWKNTANTPYIDALRTLADTMRTLDRNPNDQPSKESARKAAEAANRAVDQIKDHFESGTSEVGAEVDRLLREPIAHCQRFLKDVDPAAGANQMLRSFCDQWKPVRNKFPFDSTNGKDRTSEDDLKKIFEPVKGSLWALKNQGLVILKSDGNWTNGPAATGITLSDTFLTFFKRMSNLSDNLFGAAHQMVTLEIVPENGETVEVRIGGGAGKGRLDWPGPKPETGVFVKVGSGSITYPGRLGLYELAIKADRTSKPGTIILRKGDFNNGGAAELEVKILSVTDYPALDKLECPASAAGKN